MIIPRDPNVAVAASHAPDAPLTFRGYQSRAVRTDRTAGGDLVLPLLGLFGETGSLLSEAKKKHRDPVSYLGYEDAVLEELGDVLWYLALLASRAHIGLADVANSVSRGFSSWDQARDDDLPMAALNAGTPGAQASPTPAYDRTLLKLAGAVGLLLTRYEAGNHAENRDALSGDLVAVLRLLVHAAGEAGVTLEQAARRNLQKIFDRWPEHRVPPALFDADYAEHEQIPRSLTIEIFERPVAGKLYVFQRCNGLNIGDRLTDNVMRPDDYRFHDAFHYAYAAVLGWSPVLRALFRIKRKSRPEVDEGQDGARAVLIEEGVATWVFGHALRLDLFSGLGVGDLPLDLLKTVRRFVTGYEPEACPLWLWEEAILQGYAAFRFLKEHRKARLHLDLTARRLAVEHLAP